MRPAAVAAVLTLLAGPALAQDIVWGDDSGDFANDGECDDRRFFGEGMAVSLSWEYAGRDASDCRVLYEQGRVQIWTFEAASAATNCALIEFGDDSSQFANDGTCDDVRFEGRGTDGVMLQDDIRADATDCRRLCTIGVVLLRNY